MNRIQRLAFGGLLATLLLLCSSHAIAEGLPVPATAEQGAKQLTNLLDNADKVPGMDLDKTLNAQMDKAMAREQAKSGGKAGGENLDAALDKALDAAAAKSAPTGTAKPAADAGAAKPAATPANGDVSEQDIQSAYKQVGQTVKTVRHPFRPNAGTIITLVLGVALIVTMASVGILRYFARAVSTGLDAAEYGPGRERAPDVRYSWYYRDAIARAPVPSRPGRRR